MTRCRQATRQRAHHAAAVVDADPRVCEVTVLEPDAEPTGRWLLDIVVEDAGVPTGLFDELAFDLHLRDVSPQGEFWICHAVLS